MFTFHYFTHNITIFNIGAYFTCTPLTDDFRFREVKGLESEYEVSIHWAEELHIEVRPVKGCSDKCEILIIIEPNDVDMFTFHYFTHNITIFNIGAYFTCTPQPWCILIISIQLDNIRFNRITCQFPLEGFPG